MSQSNVPQELKQFFPKEVQESLIRLRRHLHQNPELSFKEERTSQKLYEELAQLNPVELVRVAGTGVVARIKGRNPGGPTVAVRGDIDALPIQEATGLEFASQNDGVMHACGHDVHATWTVGAAHLLAKDPAAGDVLIILQPAEEIAKGAKAILDTGILDKVSAIFGAHVDRRFEVGQVVADEGAVAAAADMFEIELVGKGAHGARPQEGNDPVVGMAALISTLQTIVSRRLDPGKAGVITVGTVRAGSAPNIIPETAMLMGTIRSFDPETRNLLHSEVKNIANSIAETFRLKCNIKSEYGTPPINNPAEPISWARQAVSALLGKEALVPLDMLNMGGEDFACYMKKIPGCFIRIGAREPGGEIIPAHSSKFHAAEESIFVGAAVLAETARVASTALSRT
ncbi:MAG: amidohydrolase [Caldithrix sp.]|nr:MAG: amidohydrolase [Caldithrix sp.]